MKIILNNREEAFDLTNITVSKLLELKNFTWKMLIIKVNGKVLKRHEYDTLQIKEGDNVSVFHLITGG
ncbi:MAG TPA: sulfur carrier protein ThiS [Lentimicrobium sp.]|nr:sulfur carrier protein ThiS [Lentimicrobium sp.]